jgi:hypothetical protein
MQTKLFIDGELTAMDEYTTRKSVWINVDATLPDWYAR